MIPAEVRSWTEDAVAAYGRGEVAEALRLQVLALAWVKTRLKPMHPFRAEVLTNLSAFLSAGGRHKEALAVTEEAVKIYRELARLNPTYLGNLASALNNQGAGYSDLDRRQEALTLMEEVVTIRRKLAQTNSTFRAELADSLANLGVFLSELGRSQDALAPTEEAVKIYRELVKTNPVFLSELARAWLTDRSHARRS